MSCTQTTLQEGRRNGGEKEEGEDEKEKVEEGSKRTGKRERGGNRKGHREGRIENSHGMAVPSMEIPAHHCRGKINAQFPSNTLDTLDYTD